ncbi:MAG: hypothetical protein WBC29_01950 [Candidatus Moraniibacteriota bacterium]
MKIGRSWKLDPTKGTATGGDADVARALHIIARQRPDDTFYLLGRNSGENPQECGYPANVVNPWTELTPKITAMKLGADVGRIITTLTELTTQMFMEMDHQIVWAGQHGTSNIPIPTVSDRAALTQPQISFVKYVSYILNGINSWRDVDPLTREEIWLCPDPRNYLKARDLKWPFRHHVIAQYNQTRSQKFERYGASAPESFAGKWDSESSDTVWLAPTSYRYGALELTALPHPDRAHVSLSHDGRYDFGMIANENRNYVSRDRCSALTEWVMPFWPDAEIFGKWTAASLKKLDRPDIRPCPYEYLASTMQRWRTTLTTPASGSGWATAKPWECFAYGVVCFFHPDYDTQGHIIPTIEQLVGPHGDMFDDDIATLARWLRVATPEDLHKRVTHLASDQAAWLWLVRTQRAYYERMYRATNGGTSMITERLQ